MLHPSYTDLMNIANSEVEQGRTACCKQPLFHCIGNCETRQTDYCRLWPLTDHNDCQKRFPLLSMNYLPVPLKLTQKMTMQKSR